MDVCSNRDLQFERLEARNRELEARIAELTDALRNVAIDIIRNDDGAIVDTLWHGNAETIIDFIGNTLGEEVERTRTAAQVANTEERNKS